MSELPDGWTQVKLPMVSQITMGQSPPSSTYNEQGQGLPFFQGKAEFGKLYPTPIKYCIVPNKIAKHNDILISVRAPVGPTNLCKERSAIGRGLAAIRPLSGIQSLYILFYLRSIEEYLSKQGTGSTFTAISKVDIEDIDIPIAPLNEQRRIVAKLEKLLAKVDACKQRLDKIPLILKRFRQSILAAACSGRLTADWRENNPDVEPASELISLLRTSAPEEHLDIFKESSQSEIPLSWIWVPLGKLGTLTSGGTPSKANYDFWNGCIPWVSPKDMKQDRISGSIDHITEEAISSSSVKKIPPGAILFVVRGMILNHTLPVAITDDFITINQDMKALTPECLEMSEYLFIASKSVSKDILFFVKEATHGTRRIETPVLRSWAIPIPPLAEQKEIVRRVETLFKIADQIEQRYQKAKAYVDQLSQSILAKAFRGELVPQDPNDEPASVLLERIRAERAKEGEKGKVKKSTGRQGRKGKQLASDPIQLNLPGMDE